MTQTLKQSSIVSYLDYFIANAKFRSISGGRIGLSVRAVANYTNFRIVFKDFENYLSGSLYFTELNKSNVDAFKHWLLIERAYSDNHASRLMGTLKTICVDAKKNDIEVHPYINYVSGFAQARQDKLINILTFSDLERIERVQLPNERLENTRKWIIIGFWLGQRVSDLLRIEPSWIRPAKNGGVYIDIVQQKTKKRVTIGVIDPVPLKILREDFPRKIGDRCFNRYMKEVCREAGIDQQVKGYKLNTETKRKELGTHPKYELLSSHDLRRSFATNFFGKIETPVLMQMTGHSRESTFLNYIGVGENKDIYANNFMEGLLALKKS